MTLKKKKIIIITPNIYFTGEKSKCTGCNRTLASASSLKQHRELYCRYREGKKTKPRATVRRDVVGIDDNEVQYSTFDRSIVRTHVSMNGLVRDYMLHMNDGRDFDVESVLMEEMPLVKQVVDKFDEFLIKGRMVLSAWFLKRDQVTHDVLSRERVYLSSLSTNIMLDFQHWYHTHALAIVKNLEKFNKHDSALEYDGMEALTLKFSLIRNLSGRGHFKLPDALKRKNAVVNIDISKECFKYALLSILHYADVKVHRERPSKYNSWLDELDFGDIDVSDVQIKDVSKIEKLNNLKINVHVWEKGLQGCIHNDRSVLAERTINLLLVVNSEGERHYCGIPSISRLYFHTKSAHNMQHMCDRCIRSFKHKEYLEEHYQWCSRGRLQIEQLPKHRHMQYNTFQKELSPLKVIYADIESYIQNDTHFPAAIASYQVWHKHFESTEQTHEKVNTWSGDECILEFLRYLDETAHKQHKHDSKMTFHNMILTIQQENEFNSTTHCPRCNIQFDEEKHCKVKEHNHINGEFRSALCRTCNLKLYLSRRTLPVIFHNFKCYDAHQIIKHGLGKFKHWQLSVIPQTKEKYMSLTARIPVDQTKEGRTIYFTVIFLDSFQFMNSSLASLVSNLDSLPLTEVLKRDYPTLTDCSIRRKGIFPYSYFTSLNTLQESTHQSRIEIKNDLNGTARSDEDKKFTQTPSQ